jgi:hypothetical protein
MSIVAISKTEHIGEFMVNLFASSEVSCVFEPRLGQSKNYYMGIRCLSVKHAASESKLLR